MIVKPFGEMTACEILSNLKEARYNTMMGKQISKIRYRSDTGAEREMHYGNMNNSELTSAITRYEALCAIETGATPSGRRCFVGGL
jgi:hypothetical protein